MFTSILKRGVQNAHPSFNLPIHSDGIKQITNNFRFLKTSSIKCNDYTYSKYTFDCPNDSVHNPPRFAKEFIKMSSIRYKPTKIYTKHCPVHKPDYKRPRCESFSSLDTTCPK